MGESIKHCKHNEDFQHDLPICKGILSFMILSTVKIIDKNDLSQMNG